MSLSPVITVPTLRSLAIDTAHEHLADTLRGSPDDARTLAEGQVPVGRTGRMMEPGSYTSTIYWIVRSLGPVGLAEITGCLVALSRPGLELDTTTARAAASEGARYMARTGRLHRTRLQPMGGRWLWYWAHSCQGVTYPVQHVTQRLLDVIADMPGGISVTELAQAIDGRAISLAEVHALLEPAWRVQRVQLIWIPASHGGGLGYAPADDGEHERAVAMHDHPAHTPMRAELARASGVPAQLAGVHSTLIAQIVEAAPCA